jgi:V-type H+-transporting ATPase subunit D
MSQQNRLPIFPSRMNLQLVQGRKKGAKVGYDLLKKKSDALKNKLSKLTKTLYDVSYLQPLTQEFANFIFTVKTSHGRSVQRGCCQPY